MKLARRLDIPCSGDEKRRKCNFIWKTFQAVGRLTLRVKAGCRKGQQGPEPTRQGGGIGQDAGPGPKCSITLLAAVGWFRGLISLDSRRVPFLSDEVVRTHRMC